MELLQLRYFKALAENGSLTRTAAQLSIAPPSLSLTITRLERELGATLFDRRGGRIRLNERGESFLRYVNACLSSLNTAAQSARSEGQEHAAAVTVLTLDQSYWNAALSLFLQTQPQTSLHHRNLRLGEGAELLAGADLVLAGAVWLTERPELTGQLLFARNRLQLLVPAGHALAGAVSLPLTALHGQRLLLPPHEDPQGERLIGLCRAAGVEPQIAAECDLALRIKLLERGVGLSFCWERDELAALVPGAVRVPLEGGVPNEPMALLWHRRRPLTAPAELFREFIVGYYGEGARQ